MRRHGNISSKIVGMRNLTITLAICLVLSSVLLLLPSYSILNHDKSHLTTTGNNLVFLYLKLLRRNTTAHLSYLSFMLVKKVQIILRRNCWEGFLHQSLMRNLAWVGIIISRLCANLHRTNHLSILSLSLEAMRCYTSVAVQAQNHTREPQRSLVKTFIIIM